MAVSYLSTKPFKGSEYVLPVSLDLLARVNTYKQERFYTNAEAIKNKYSQLLNSDIINQEQKDHLKNKYNNLTSQIEEWGGIDYSDLNIQNQISGYAQDVYNDPVVVNGIASTRKIRSLQANYDKIKNDPKLSKYYAPQNEWWDSQNISEYVNGGIDAAYTGPSTPTIYSGNPYQALTAKMKELRPDVEVGIDPDTNKYYFKNTKNEILDSGKIYAELQGQLDPSIMNQIKINANYSMQGLNAQDIENIYVRRNNKQISDINSNIKNILSNIQTETDNNKKNRLLQELDKNTADLQAAKDSFDLASIRNRSKTKEGMISLKADIGLQNIFDAATTAYSYKKINSTLQLNQAEIMKDKLAREDAKLALAAEKMNADEKYRYAALDLKREENALKREKQAAELGNSNSNNFLSETGTDYQNEDEVKAATLTSDKINGIIAESINRAAVATKNAFMDNVGNTWGDYIKQIESIDGKSGITTEEIAQAAGLGTHRGKPSISMNTQAQKWFTNAYNALIRSASGDQNALKDINFNPQEIENLNREIRTANVERQFYTDLKNKARDYALNEYASKNKMTREQVNSILNGQPIGGVGATGTGRTGAIDSNNPRGYLPQSRINSIAVEGDLKKYEDKFLDKSEYRQIYSNIYLPSYQYSKFSSDMQALLGNDPELVSVDKETIKPLIIQKLPTTSNEYKEGKRYRVQFQYGSGKNIENGVRFLDGAQAERFGVKDDPAYKLDLVLKQRGELPDFPVTVTLPTGDTALNVKTTHNKSNGLTQVWVNGIPIRFNGRDFNGFSSAGHAEQFITEVLKEAGKNSASREDLINKLKDISKGKF